MRTEITFPAHFERRGRAGPDSVIDWVLLWGKVSYSRTCLDHYAFLRDIAGPQPRDPRQQAEMVLYVLGWPHMRRRP